jgi:hypothetical protein
MFDSPQCMHWGLFVYMYVPYSVLEYPIIEYIFAVKLQNRYG